MKAFIQGDRAIVVEKIWRNGVNLKKGYCGTIGELQQERPDKESIVQIWLYRLPLHDIADYWYRENSLDLVSRKAKRNEG